MIKIYGVPGCHWCERAVSLCGEYELAYEYVEVTTEQKKQEFRRMFPKAHTVPQITWHGRHIGGYEQLGQEIEQTISNYGH